MIVCWWLVCVRFSELMCGDRFMASSELPLGVGIIFRGGSLPWAGLTPGSSSRPRHLMYGRRGDVPLPPPPPGAHDLIYKLDGHLAADEITQPAAQHRTGRHATSIRGADAGSACFAVIFAA